MTQPYGSCETDAVLDSTSAFARNCVTSGTKKSIEDADPADYRYWSLAAAVDTTVTAVRLASKRRHQARKPSLLIVLLVYLWAAAKIAGCAGVTARQPISFCQTRVHGGLCRARRGP
jgi:hypothetical protein